MISVEDKSIVRLTLMNFPSPAVANSWRSAALRKKHRPYARASLPGRNRLAANTPRTMNTSRTIPCAIANGGSDPVGARVQRASEIVIGRPVIPAKAGI